MPDGKLDIPISINLPKRDTLYSIINAKQFFARILITVNPIPTQFWVK